LKIPVAEDFDAAARDITPIVELSYCDVAVVVELDYSTVRFVRSIVFAKVAGVIFFTLRIVFKAQGSHREPILLSLSKV
jgi:hypothetical protein